MKPSTSRRTFLKASALSTGGLFLGIVSLPALGGKEKENLDEWTGLNAYIKIKEDGQVIIMSPNPEGGQNVKTSMPMIVAEELDVNWAQVQIEQAHLDVKHFTRQFIGGSQAIRSSWHTLRTAGAAARYMLRQAAAKAWAVSFDEISTAEGMLIHNKTGKRASYGQFATAAASVDVPEEVELKKKKDFKIIGHSKKNVEARNIVMGKPLFGIDEYKEGMQIAMIVHPKAFGTKLKSFDASKVLKMPGIRDVFAVKVFNEDFEKQFFDTLTFNEVVAIVGDSTWQVMQAKKALEVIWEPIESYSESRSMFGRQTTMHIPSGLESSTDHYKMMEQRAGEKAQVQREDGQVAEAFASAAKIVERTYLGPYLAHNCMEPMNFFAHVTADKAELAGPLQKPEFTEQALSARIGMPLENIDIRITRLGGGFGRRSYAHWLIEAALISQKVQAPIKLVYSREDDMTAGIYRPTYRADYRAAFDAQYKLIGFHVKAGGIPESPLAAHRFPAGAVENYLAEEWTIDTNLTTGSFRAPRSNFMAAAEQSFLDELAEIAGKDPIDFRLELLQKSIDEPVGGQMDYEPERYMGVLKLVREKSNWDARKKNENLGVSAYFSHNTYAAHVLELTMEKGQPKVKNVCTAIDCGLLINPDAAVNMTQGAVVDGIGTGLYGKLSVNRGVPESQNFDTYRMIRMQEAPEKIDVHFVESEIDPTGMGEPAYPPIFGALANALYRATGKRFYNQPFVDELEDL
ncbi:molybdopterin-dependent oxidoreductase [Marinilongibacter aquaticus]|uniref:xanthine dehydrogenase family protein molybdopterin-binding subunit n=1 Tax=Marinilongibacter aquaticus TaxID=2975157 RepID=UPI0021BD5AC4|nr:molybdopterin cofactor-binding domain-containing protein [Marinilongibacter aquaticus]UBM60219.1 molybdopterin-dependent oxidoreductase [Marinilongibacter aquaticus]